MESANEHQGHNLLTNAANRVWEEMFVCKRPALEEVFKTSFGNQNTTPKLEKVRGQISEAAANIWQTFLESERRATHTRTQAWEFHTQLESRIQRITGGFAGGLKRLTSVTSTAVASGIGGATGSAKDAEKAKKEEPPSKVEYSNLPRTVVEQATFGHISIVKDVVEQHYRNRAQTDQHMLKYVEEEWLQGEARLTQERGLWGPFSETDLAKWMLDQTEGPSRMRQRLIRNDLFYLHYPYREQLDPEGNFEIAKKN